MTSKEVILIPSDVIYGEDDRVEITDSDEYTQFSKSIASMVEKSDLIKIKDGYSFIGETLRESQKLCHGERFGEQNVLGGCSGFLISDKLLVTAGHCFVNESDCRRYFWVFDYTLENSKNKKINSSQVSSCKRILSYSLDDITGSDFAVIELDSSVERLGLPFETFDNLRVADEVFMIGYPSGLPIKAVKEGTIRKNSEKAPFFETNLDSFYGNSGSPVFNSTTRKVEGILIRGDKDYIKTKDGCYKTNICQESGCDGEGVTKIGRLDLNKFSTPSFIRGIKLLEEVKENNIKAVEELLVAGVNINAQTGFLYQTPLMLAIKNDFKDMVELLYGYNGNDFSLRDKDGKSMIDYLEERSLSPFYSEILINTLVANDMLLKNKDKNGKTLLMSLAAKNDYKTLRRLFSYFPDVSINEVEDLRHWSALMYAAYNNSGLAAGVLLRRKDLDLNLFSLNGWSAFLYAANFGESDLISKMLERDDLITNIVHPLGFTSLMLSMNNDDTKVYELLVSSKKINLNLQNHRGETILHQAILKKKINIIKDLLNRGIDITIKNTSGMTALDLAILSKDQNIVKLFKK